MVDTIPGFWYAFLISCYIHAASRLQLAYRPLNTPPLFKGEREGVPQAYTLTSSFSIPGKDLAGFCEMVGTYELDKENPQRMHVAFTGEPGMLRLGRCA